jgi:glycerol 3-phosphatase-2
MTTLDNGPVTTFRAPATTRSLSAAFRGVVCDLDGVVYRGHVAVPYAVKALEALREAGRGVVYATNNASRTPQEVATQLTELGLTVRAEHVVTSAQAGAARLAELLPEGSEVLAIGGEGVVEALRGAGLTPLRAGVVAARAAVERGAVEPAAANAARENGGASPSVTPVVAGVLQGYGPEVAWGDLAEAAYAVQSGAVWVATNVDTTLPTARGMAPGNGTLVDAVRQATGAEPVVVGKPDTPLYDLSARVLGNPPHETLAIGDRLDTDIAGANAAGMPSLLVLTGVHGIRQVAWAEARERPRYLATDLRALDVPYVEAVQERGGWTCGPARAEVDREGTVMVGPAGSPDQRLRCVVAALWSVRDGGRQLPPRDDEVWDRLAEHVAGEVTAPSAQ